MSIRIRVRYGEKVRIVRQDFFFTIMINMLRDLMERVDNMQEQIDNVIKEKF